MERLIILLPPDGGSREAVEIGDVDASGFRCDPGRSGTGSLGLRGSAELIEVLTKGFNGGYGERTFHLKAGDRLLANCTIVRHDSCIHFEFMDPPPQDHVL